MTPEYRNSSLLGNGDKQVPAKVYTHTTIELPFLCNGEVNTPLQKEKNCYEKGFYVFRAEKL
jgi:hypothetical protein